jgi:hypothetical protein
MASMKRCVNAQVSSTIRDRLFGESFARSFFDRLLTKVKAEVSLTFAGHKTYPSEQSVRVGGERLKTIAPRFTKRFEQPRLGPEFNSIALQFADKDIDTAIIIVL